MLLCEVYFQEFMHCQCGNQSVEDSLYWKGTSNNSFSVSDFYSKSLAIYPVSEVWKNFWKGIAPPKVEAFSWRLLWSRLPTKVELRLRKSLPSSSALCPFCQAADESTSHLFFECWISWRIWKACSKYWGISMVFSNDPHTFYISWCFAIAGKSEVWHMLFHAVAWTIWTFRNSMVFNKKKLDVDQICNLVLVRLGFWCKESWPSQWVSMDSFLGDPSLFIPIKKTKLQGRLSSSHAGKYSDVDFTFKVDAAVDHVTGRAGIGGILLGHDGVRLDSFSKAIGSSTPIFAEFRAISEALAMAAKSNRVAQGSVVIESDCMNLVTWFNLADTAPILFKERIAACKEEFKNLRWSIVHVPREMNSVADSLAKQGISMF